MLDVWPFCDQERSLPPPIKITLPTFMAKKSAMKQSFFLFFLDNNQKIFRSNLVLEVVFVSESEGLYYLAVADPGEPIRGRGGGGGGGYPGPPAPPPPPPPPPPPHLILRPNWDPAKGRKKSFGDHAPSHLSMGLHDRPPPSPLISRSASDTVSYNLTCRFQPLHFGDVVVQLKYTRIASVSCFL